ncbi:nuclear transport factor 2 family protein [Rhodococcus opacus]|uniref:nuclear transport factor 2 family protein n=1 Tax=Rhodococcus opacus TaxID=37919 RepID=UPI0022363BF7|nr:nuclear transport factor 2 family protein [Rhodococcus opacus]UZG59667.1 nuclear transport factor 2 family protein [Rhodococcus opacus]
MTDIHLGDIRHHIHNLLGTYAENADDRNADAVTELFSHASVTFAGTVLHHRQDISAHYRTLFAAAPRSRHLLTNIIIDVTDAEQADARCRYSRWSIESDATLLAIGDYHATFHRHHNHWRFASFTVSRAWQTPS